MSRYEVINGIRRQLSATEEAECDARDLAWTNEAFNREIAKVRKKRNNLLVESDWVVLPDSPIADKTAWQNYRQELRDITNGLTTVEDVNSVTWPTKPGA